MTRAQQKKSASGKLDKNKIPKKKKADKTSTKGGDVWFQICARRWRHTPTT